MEKTANFYNDNNSDNENNKPIEEVLSKPIYGLDIYQQVSLESYIAGGLFTSRGVADLRYLTYQVMNGTPDNIKPFLAEILSKYFEDEQDFQQIVLDAKLDQVRLDLWVGKIFSMIAFKVFYEAPANLSFKGVNKVEVGKSYVKSCMANFIRQVRVVDRYACEFLLDEILATDELDFLHSLAFACKRLHAEVDKTDIQGAQQPSANLVPIKKEVMGMLPMLNARGMLNVDAELARALKSSQDKSETEQAKDLEPAKDTLATLGDKIEKTIKEIEEFATGRAESFVVQKFVKGTTKLSTEHKFKTLNEAENFIKDISKNYPDLLEDFDFKIVAK